MNNYDICIIGAGVAGSFAAYKLAKEYKNLKVIVFDIGRPPAKRRRQIEGWLGILPNSDGKLYFNDQDKVADICGLRKTKSEIKWFSNVLKNVTDLKLVKDKAPNAAVSKRINRAGYSLALNNHYQIYPRDIHALSKFMINSIESAKNITFSFDNEVKDISKNKNIFHITTDLQEVKAKKLLLCVGRSGWRWVTGVYKKFGIIESNNIARFGVRIELPSTSVKDFNKSNCTLTKGVDVEIGPFSWFGTVIPEDHVDLAISAFRSNEARWKSDKVSFALIGNYIVGDNDTSGTDQTDRVGKLTFLLANDRVIKERVSTVMAGKSKICLIKEYGWINKELENLAQVIPDLLAKAYFHIPTILPLVPSINIGNDLSTEVDGMHVAGESAGITGILAAGAMGAIAANAMAK